MSRCIVLLGLLCGTLAFSPSANAQGIWIGGFGFGPGLYGSGFSPYGFGNAYAFGGPGLYRSYSPVAFGYPAGWSRISAARPVVAVAPYVGRPVVAARPAVALPLNRAYRRIYRRGW